MSSSDKASSFSPSTQRQTVLLARPGEEDGDVMLNPSVFDATALI